MAWLAGRLLLDDAAAAGPVRVSWSYRNRLAHVVLGRQRAQALVDAVRECSTMDDLLARLNACGTEAFETTKEFRKLRRAGLAAF
jgi:hypothetical protein